MYVRVCVCVYVCICFVYVGGLLAPRVKERSKSFTPCHVLVGITGEVSCLSGKDGGGGAEEEDVQGLWVFE